MITPEIFDLPCAVKAPKSFDAIDWKVSSFFIISLYHLGVRIKRSCLRIYGEPVNKEFSFQFSRKCMTPWKGDRVTCLVQLKIFAVRRSQNLIKSHSSFGQRIISFKETKIPFGKRIVFFERVKIPFGEDTIPHRGSQNSLRGTNSHWIVNSPGRRINQTLGQNSTVLGSISTVA